jgi:hypothetical protein
MKLTPTIVVLMNELVAPPSPLKTNPRFSGLSASKLTEASRPLNCMSRAVSKNVNATYPVPAVTFAVMKSWKTVLTHSKQQSSD